LGKFRPSDFKIKQSPATHIFLSLVETNIIDELILLKHKVKLPMVFPGNPSRSLRKPMPFCFFPDIRKKLDYLIGYQVKLQPF
jgi:hypothetical protein